jgi:hypothetical protein
MLLILVIHVNTGLKAQVLINEFMASNSRTIPDPDFNQFSDWLELHNPSNQAVQLDGYYLSDDKDNPMKWRFPAGITVDAQGFLLVWADSRDVGKHANFKLNKDGGYIGLFDPWGIPVDQVTYGKQRFDVSSSRLSTGDWGYSTEPTPGEENSNNMYYSILDGPVANSLPGFYNSGFLLNISSITGDPVVRYTLDGSEPRVDSPVLTNDIEVDRTRTARSKTFQTGHLPSETLNTTYFLNAPVHQLPVFSITSAPAHFWDSDSGLYVKYKAEDSIEIPIGVEFFEDGMQMFQVNAGAEIYGGATRGAAQKSLEIKFRSRYGDNELKFRFFDKNERDRFNAFILRNSGNDWSDGSNWLGSMFSDGLQHSIVEGKMDLDMQSYRPAVVYLNGEYWGIHNIREKLDKGYAAYHLGVNPDNLDMIKLGAKGEISIQEGDTLAFGELIRFVEMNDMRVKANYEHARDRVDIHEFIQYQIVQNFVANIDWPHNNQKFYRERTPTGKWRWMIYDLDFGFNGFKFTDNSEYPKWWTGYKKDMYPQALNPTMGRFHTGLMRGLINNEEFVNDFVQCYAHHLNTTFKPARTLGFIQEIKSSIEPEMPRHIARWGSQGGTSSLSAWQLNINKMIDFANLRPGFVWKHTMQYFSLPDTTTIELEIDDPLGGTVLIQNLSVEGNTYKGYYFSKVPLRLEAITYPGFTFTGWSGDTISSSSRITILPGKTKKLKANFVETSRPVINELCAINKSIMADEHGEFDDWVEIYNPSAYPVDLGGWYLTDNIKQAFKWKIPNDQPGETTIAPGAYMVFWLDNQSWQGPRHAGFSLSKEGEQIALVFRHDEYVSWVDSLSFSMQSTNISYGRYPNATGDFCYLKKATPGSMNAFSCLTVARVSNISSVQVAVYPNPAQEYMWVKLEGEVQTKDVYPARLDIINLNGTVVQSIHLEDNNLSWQVDVSGLRPGIYLIRIQSKDGSFTSKLVKQ